MGRDLHTRPSKLYGVRPKLTAFYFDRAVETFGRTVEAEVRTASEGQKTQKAAEQKGQRVLDRWLASADDPTVKKSAGKFRDPFADPTLRAQLGG